MSLQSNILNAYYIDPVEKKSLICSAVLTTADIYSLLYCGAFLFTMHVVAEEIR